MSLGWIKLHRKLQDNSLWLDEPFTRGQAWVDLVMLANHKPGYIRIAGQRIDVPRGSVGRGKEGLSKRWKWSRGKVNRFIKELENEGQISQKAVHRISLISICNYSEYQDDGTPDGTRDGTRDGHGTVHETDTNKNVKNVKNGKNNNITEPEIKNRWLDFVCKNHGYLPFRIHTAANIEIAASWVSANYSEAEVSSAVSTSQAATGDNQVSLAYVSKVLAGNRKPAKQIQKNETPIERAARMVAEDENRDAII